MFGFWPKLIQFNIQFNIVSRKFNSKDYSIQNHFKKIQFKKLFICQFFEKIQFKNLFIFFIFYKIQFKNIFIFNFFIKIQFKNLFKIMKLAVFNSIKYSFNKKTRVSDRATCTCRRRRRRELRCCMSASSFRHRGWKFGRGNIDHWLAEICSQQRKTSNQVWSLWTWGIFTEYLEYLEYPALNILGAILGSDLQGVKFDPRCGTDHLQLTGSWSRKHLARFPNPLATASKLAVGEPD